MGRARADPLAIFQEAAKIGLYSLDFFATQFFEESGLGFVTAVEELFWGDAGIGLSLVGSTLAAVAVVSNGTPEQIGEWCPQMFGDGADVKLGAFCAFPPNLMRAVTSPRSVPAPSMTRRATSGPSTASRRGPPTAGSRTCTSSSPRWTRPSGRGARPATIAVLPGTKGLSQGQKFKKHGVRASHTAEVILDDVRVPGRCLVGGKDKLDRRLARVREGGRGGDQAAMKTFEASRPSVAAMAVGVGRAAVEFAAEYAGTRAQFGKPIGTNQGVAFQLADMAASVDAARLLAWRAAWMARQGKPFTPRGGLDVQAGRRRDGRPGD